MPSNDPTSPIGDADGDLDALDVKVDAAATSYLALEQRPERQWRPSWVDPVVTGAAEHPPAAPEDQADDDGFESPACVGETVFDALGTPRRVVAHEESLFGELGEPLGEKRRADPAERTLELSEAAVSEEQLAHDEQTPAVPDPVQRAGQSAELTI